MKINLKGTGNQIVAAVKANYKPILTGIGGLLLTYVLGNSTITLSIGGDESGTQTFGPKKVQRIDSMSIARTCGSSTEKAIVAMHDMANTMTFSSDKLVVCRDIYNLVKNDPNRTDSVKSTAINAISKIANTMTFSNDKTYAMSYISKIVALPVKESKEADDEKLD